MTLSIFEIARILAITIPTTDVAITGYTIDSREVRPGDRREERTAVGRDPARKIAGNDDLGSSGKD